MNEIETIFKKASDSVKMTDVEKARIRVSAFAAPVSPAISPWLVFFRTHVPATAFVAFLFFTGATSAIAERALPGDVLYPIKTKVNEPAASLIARRGPDAETRWEASIARRRLDEAKALLDDPSKDGQDFAREVRAAAEERIARLEALTGMPAEDDELPENPDPQTATMMVASLPAEEAPVQALMMATEPAGAEQDEEYEDEMEEGVAMKAREQNGDLPMESVPEQQSVETADAKTVEPISPPTDLLSNLEARLAQYDEKMDLLSLKGQAVFYRAQALVLDARTAFRDGDDEAYEEALIKLSRALDRLDTIQASQHKLQEMNVPRE